MTENNETPLAPESSDAAGQGDRTPAADAAASAAPLPAADAADAGLPAASAATAALPPQPVGLATEAAAAPPAPAKSFWSRTGTRVVAGVAAGVVLLGIGFGGGWAAHGELRGFGHSEAQSEEWSQGPGDGHGDRGGHGDSEFRGGDGFRDDRRQQNGGGQNGGTGQNGTQSGSPNSPGQSPAPESTTPSD